VRFCLFGTYTVAEGYPVNRVLQEGLARAGHDVVVCRREAWGPFVHRALSWRHPARLAALLGRIVRAWVALWRAYRRLQEVDWVLVGYPGYFDVHLARRLSRGRPVALISFISLYDTAVSDRDRVGSESPLARLLYRIDRAAFDAADAVLVDTEAQGRYYAELFAMEPGRFVRSFVGEDDTHFSPHPDRPRGDGPLRVLFFGTYVPLHGVETIIEAAHLLRDDDGIHFTLVGKGPDYPRLRERARQLAVDVDFRADWIGTEELVGHIVDAHVCLGVFGTTAKAARVIPYKVFDAAAVGRAIITRDSPAIRELFADGESALLCGAGQPEPLATAIRRLRDDDELRMRLGAAGHAVYCARGGPEAVGRDLAESLRVEI
jgi:glycosyltransferase involved in cell wall biosynthesis